MTGPMHKLGLLARGRKPRLIWAAFAACMLVVLCVLAWVSVKVLELEDAQNQAAQQAAVEERVRLALWRMDSALSPLITLESSRPYFAYSSFYPAERAYGRMYNGDMVEEVMLASPLLKATPPQILLHFQIGPDGQLSSPQVPSAVFRGYVQLEMVPQPRLEESTRLMERLASKVGPGRILAAASAVVDPQALVQNEIVLAEISNRTKSPAAQGLGNSQITQQARGGQEYIARNAANSSTLNNPLYQSGNSVLSRPVPSVAEGQFAPVWVDSSLMLVRKVAHQSGQFIQGCWLDWDTIRASLLASVSDLLPEARLEGVADVRAEGADRLLASLPAKLLPGNVPPEPSQRSPLWWSLVVGWTCVVVAGLVAAWLLHGAVSLSEKRGAFVSAVTHEMRTPLTTFRMYSEMLAEGMVEDPARQREYLRTMCQEADRLGHMVQNVLAYSRLEQSGNGPKVQALDVVDLLERNRQRLADRASAAGMSLEIHPPADGTAVRAAGSSFAIEQILMNLVDNACKYAAGSRQPLATPKPLYGGGRIANCEHDCRLDAGEVDSTERRRLVIQTDVRGKMLAISVRDFGPGIGPDCRWRLFKPFTKSAAQAADSAAGVGLGLALSRRLARDMGGDLVLDANVKDGACLVLLLRKE